MVFRDDQEALRARADALERALRERKEHEEKIEKEVRELQRKLQKLTREGVWASLRAVPPWRSLLACAVASAVIAAIMARIVAGAATRNILEAHQARQAEVSPTPPPPEPVVYKAPPPPPPVVYEAPPPPPLPPPDTSDAQWTGSISKLSGTEADPKLSSLAPGARCTLTIDRYGLERFQEPSEIVVQCDRKELYRWSQGGGNLTRRECRYIGQEEKTGALFAASCSDRGIRGDLPEMELDTLKKSLRLLRSTAPAWEVEITLDHPAALATFPGKFYYTTNALPVAEGRERTGKVIGVQGSAPVTPEESCKLVLQPSNKSWRANCEVHLSCGSDLLGTAKKPAPARCGVDEDLIPVRIKPQLDDTHDLLFEIDLKAGTGKVVVTGETASWSVTVALDP